MKYWVTFQLSEKGEHLLEEEPKIIENIIRKHLRSPYFIPMYYNKSKTYENKIFLFRGYVFVEFCEKEIPFYTTLSSTQYFVGPLLVNGRIHLTPNKEIKKLQTKLNKIVSPVIKVGDKVLVLDGKHKNLQAIVTDYYPESERADLIVALKCMNIIVPKIPISCLKNITQEEKKKNSLLDKILTVLRNYPKGLTRKQILMLMSLNDKEKKRVSTCLSRATSRKIVKSFLNKEKKSVFALRK